MGGLIPGQAYLARGGPGCGKTTLGMDFPIAGSSQGEKTLLITLGESETQLRQNGAADAGTGRSIPGVNLSLMDVNCSAECFAPTLIINDRPSFSPDAIAHCWTTVPDCGTAIARVYEDAQKPGFAPLTLVSQLWQLIGNCYNRDSREDIAMSVVIADEILTKTRMTEA